MPPVSAAKPRTQRIPLNYYKKPNRMERWKLVLACTALGLTALWLASGLLSDGTTNERYSHGDLAAKHQHIDANCAACHVAFSPISRSAWSAWLSAPVSTDSNHVHVLAADAKCQACHPFNTLADIHHGNQKLESLTSCGSCHSDHRGRNANLLQVADSDCTSCHRDLTANRTAESLYTDRREEKDALANHITGFARPDQGHPNFRALSQPDPGVIQFNHKLHTTSGIVYAEGAREMTLGDVKARDTKAFERYAKLQGTTDEKAAVKLDCAACHEPGGQGFTQWRPGKGDGAYMQPIRYENHCKACHPLRFDDDPKLSNATVPHGVQPEEIERIVRRFYATDAARDAAALTPPAVPLPGKPPGASPPKPTNEARAQLALRMLFVGKKTCGECHEYERKPDGDRTSLVPARIVTAPSGKGQPWHTSATSIPEIWFPHAKFNHKSHRNNSDGNQINCRECHANAETSRTHKDVLLPDVDTCRKCHAPAGSVSINGGRGSRHDCTECHNFHHADDPAGRPAEAGDKVTR